MKNLLSIAIASGLAASLLSPAAGVTAPEGRAAPLASGAVATASVPAEGFETGDDWTVVAGDGVIASSSDATEGAQSLRLDYNVSSRPFEIGRVSTPDELPTAGLRALQLDVKGDGSFNTLYLRLRDATGEVLYYRVGNLNSTAWSTQTVDLTRPPAASTGGNGDGAIDAPASLFRFVVVRNGSQPPTGTIRLDNLRVDDSGWTAPSTDSPTIVPGTTTVPLVFRSGAAGDWRLRLTDPSGRVKTFSGTSTGSTTVTVRWDGRSDNGTALAGVVRGALEYDESPGDGLAGAMTVAAPYLLGASRRAESDTRGSLAAVNSSLTTYDSLSKADTDAAAMEEAYVRYAREEFEWNRVEPREGFFDWPKFDQAVAVARARNIDIIGKLVYSADWASSAPSGTPSATARYFPPTDYSDYVAYAVATVERYKDDVKVWEIWNEPNIATYWKPSPDPTAYARLLKLTYAAIKEVQPDAIVLTGGLAGYSEQFMTGLVDAGAMQSFDGFGLHTYVEGPPEPSTLDSWIASAQSFLARNAPGRQIWITETGWSTCTSCSASAGVSESQQADFLSRSMVDAAGHGIAAYAWYNLVEFGTTGSRLDNYGLIEQSGRRKPAFTALARTASALAGSTAAGTAAPSTGASTVISDLASTTGVRARSVGTGATSALQAVSNRVGGSGALALDYNYTAATAEGTAVLLDVPVAGRPSAISVWVYGDNSSSPVYVKVRDANGEFFEAKVGNAGPAEWTRQTLFFDGLNPSFKSYGSNVDGKVDYPITVTELHVFKSTTNKTQGRIILDDLTAHYGTNVRGGIFYGRNFVTQAIYRDSPATTKIAVANTTAYSYDRGSLQALTVDSDLAASVTASSAPKFVVSTNRVSPASAQPGADVAFRTVTGDRTVLTMQIYTTSGRLVRTITDARAYISGAREIVWNGKNADGTTPAAGGYRFRLEVSGADGRRVAWGRPFTILE